MNKPVKPGGLRPVKSLDALMDSVSVAAPPVAIERPAAAPAPAVTPDPVPVAVREPTPAPPAPAAPAPAKKMALRAPERADRPAQNPVYPWKGADPRIVVGYNVRMKQPLHEKIRWIVENAPGKRSIQTLAVAAIEAECDRILEEMGIKP